MPKKARGALDGIDPGDLSGAIMVVAGSEAAEEYLPGDSEPLCDNCGRPIKYVFITPTGHKLGGDCLATLTGDDSTRRSLVAASKKAVGATSIRVGASSVYAVYGSGAFAKAKPVYGDMRLESATWASQAPEVRRSAHQALVRFAGSLADMLGIPLKGHGIVPVVTRNRRTSARRNPAGIVSVLDLVEGSLKGVYRAWEPLPDDGGEQFPLHHFAAVTKHGKDRVEREPDKHVLISDYLIFSDYTGSDVERSNVRVFFKEHGDKPGVYRVYGGYGTSGIAIRLDVADEGILEDLERLDNYPILDEDDVGSVSLELADEAAESYGYGDFEREINKQFGVTILEDSKSQKLRDLFWQATQDLPEGFVVETGGNVHFDIERMVEGLSDDALEEAGIEYESDED